MTKQTIKILLIAPRFHTNLYYRVLALQNKGLKVKVLVLYKGKSEYYKDIDIQQIGTSFFSRFILSIIAWFKTSYLQNSLEMRLQSPNKELRRIVKTFKPDAIMLKAFQNMLAIKTLLIAKKHKAKVLMLTQTTITHIKGSKYLFKLNIKLFKYLKVHAYITPIKENYDAFKNFGIKNVFYLPFVFPSNKDIIPKQSINNTIQVISIGKYIKRKEQLLLIQACEKLLKQGFLLELNIYGEKADNDYFEKILTYIAKHKLEQNVNIATNVNYLHILKEYSNNDLFVLPSYAEPAAYTPVEAMAYGLPVICSTQNGTKCYIKDSKNGYIFKAKDLDDLVNKMELCLENLTTMSENALSMAKKNHSLEGFATKIMDIIQAK